MFWVISVYFNVWNILPKSGTFRPGHPVATCTLLYTGIMVPAVLYGCETWTLALREEHRLRVIENRVLRKLFRPERNRVTSDWRKIHNKEFHDLYSSPDTVRVSSQEE